MSKTEICPVCHSEVEESYYNEYECGKCGTEFHIDENGRKRIDVKGSL